MKIETEVRSATDKELISDVSPEEIKELVSRGMIKFDSSETVVIRNIYRVTMGNTIESVCETLLFEIRGQ